MTAPRLTEQEISKLRALEAKATPGPWTREKPKRDVEGARTALPRLLAEREEMAKELREALALLEGKKHTPTTPAGEPKEERTR